MDKKRKMFTVLHEIRKLSLCIFAFNESDHFGVGNLGMVTRKEGRRSWVLI